jgi:two-component system response regulator VanR
MAVYNILVVEDEQEIAAALEVYLKNQNYNVFKAYDGEKALAVFEREEIHLVLMDVMMPKLDGIKATLKIREKSNVPIIFLSAKSEDTDKILGLNIGADDYITKPFNPLELLAWVNSNLRRYTSYGNGAPVQEDVIRIGGIELNDAKKEVKVAGGGRRGKEPEHENPAYFQCLPRFEDAPYLDNFLCRSAEGENPR